MTDEQIVASLSPMEREWIAGWEGPSGAAFNAVAGMLRQKGLLNGALDWNLNATGLRIRKALEQSK